MNKAACPLFLSSLFLSSRMIRIIVCVSLSILLLSSSACGLDLPKAKVTLKVVDENGLPIKGAKTGVGFESVYRMKKGINDVGIDGITDEKGMFTASHDTMGYIGYGAEVSGYYRSQGEYRFTKHESSKWQPWNPEIKVVMRKKENPVPMYARDLKMAFPIVEIPVIGKKVGFDLIEYDWVAPYGKGKHFDFIFKLEKKYTDANNYDSKLTITFPNKFDGIQIIRDDRRGGSMFKLPRFAAEEGYQPKLTRFLNRHGVGATENDLSDDNNYVFRIRSEEKDGKLVKAMYGKIHGDMQFYPGGSKTASLGFKYFINPDYTRNLEWSGVNLFTLPRGEQVGTD